MDDQHVRRHRYQADRNEVRQRVVGEIVVEARIDRVADRHDDEGVAVGGCLGGDLGRDPAPGAGTRLDHDGSIPALLQALPSEPGEYFRRSARRERIQESNRFRRVVRLRLRADDQQHETDEDRKSIHRIAPYHHQRRG